MKLDSMNEELKAGSLKSSTFAKTPEMTSVEHTFLSKGIKCAGTMFLPKGITDPPIVIMGHGFGAIRAMNLKAYAERFVHRGMAVFTFDYRCHGVSEGTPRNYINPKQQVEDFEAAITYVRSLKGVDVTQIALWGSAFSGGHVLVVAARDKNISAIVSQGPFVDGLLNLTHIPLFYQIRAFYHGVLDILSSLLLGRRHYVRVAGTRKQGNGKFAIANSDEALPGESKLLGSDDPLAFEKSNLNLCQGNFSLLSIKYRPLRHVRNITCPALIIGMEHDIHMFPTGGHKAAQRMKNVTYIGYQATHYSIYFGELFEKSVAQQADFLEASLVTPGKVYMR